MILRIERGPINYQVFCRFIFLQVNGLNSKQHACNCINAYKEMSDSELAHKEILPSKEDALLFTQQEKAKHASSYSEKDDANLLSDGTSEDGEEDDLVLEYSGWLAFKQSLGFVYLQMQ